MILFNTSFVLAEDFYIAQTYQGGNTGADCSDAYAVTFFNTSGNWTNPKTSGKIGPGDTVHLCGTITSSLNFQNSGSSGSVITLLFESGAIMSNTGTAWNSSGPISLNGHNYILINGGIANIGGATANIQATGNGSGLSSQVSIQAINLNSSHDVEIKNLGCSNLYIHNSVTDTALGSDTSACIYANPQGANISIHDSTFHDNQDGILFSVASSGTMSMQVYNMNMYNMDHFLFTTCNASGSSGFYFYNNNIHDPANWDTTANAYHHDGWIMNINTGQTCDQAWAYNNQFGGNWGSNNTSPLFFDYNGGVLEHTYIFNNVFINTNISYPWSNGINLLVGPTTAAGPLYVWNNTVICGNLGSGFQIGGSNIDFRNNVESSCQEFINTSIASSATISAMDYNYYANSIASGNQIFSFLTVGSGSGNLVTQFAKWQIGIQGVASGSEAHSEEGVSAGLNSSGIPQSGSPVIGAGVNLTSLGIAALNTDINGNARSVSGAWDIGAYQSIRPMPPVNLRIQ